MSNDTPYQCLLCSTPLAWSPANVSNPAAVEGLSLDDSSELHVCRECFESLAPAEQLEACRRWRRDRHLRPLVDAAIDLMGNTGFPLSRLFGEN